MNKLVANKEKGRHYHTPKCPVTTGEWGPYEEISAEDIEILKLVAHICIYEKKELENGTNNS